MGHWCIKGGYIFCALALVIIYDFPGVQRGPSSSNVLGFFVSPKFF